MPSMRTKQLVLFRSPYLLPVKEPLPLCEGGTLEIEGAAYERRRFGLATRHTKVWTSGVERIRRFPPPYLAATNKGARTTANAFVSIESDNSITGSG